MPRTHAGEELSKWAPTRAPGNAKHEDPAEARAVFVDENSCIGCKNCVWCAAATFRIEEGHGRSRVFGQWLNTEDELQTAIDSCPVDCIHWVDRSELPALEYVCQKIQVSLRLRRLVPCMRRGGVSMHACGAGVCPCMHGGAGVCPCMHAARG